MNHPRISLLGKAFGRLTVLSEAVRGTEYGQRRLLCLCSCGREKVVPYGSLVSGSSRSCGCLRREVQKGRVRTRKGRELLKANKLACKASQLTEKKPRSLRSVCKEEDVNYKQIHILLARGDDFLSAVSYCKSKGYAFTSPYTCSTPISATTTLEKD